MSRPKNFSKYISGKKDIVKKAHASADKTMRDLAKATIDRSDSFVLLAEDSVTQPENPWVKVACLKGTGIEAIAFLLFLHNAVAELVEDLDRHHKAGPTGDTHISIAQLIQDFTRQQKGDET